MNKLYYVPMYHFRQNCWSRWMVTASYEEEASTKAEEQMGPDWRPGCVKFIALVRGEVFMEV